MVAARGLFSSCCKWGPPFSCAVQAPRGGGFSCCRARALECAGSVVVARGLSCPTACGVLDPGPGVKPVYLALAEKAMAPHSSTLAWKIPWMEEPGGLQSMGSRRVGYDRVTSLSLFTFMHWRRKCNPLQCSFLENPRDGGAWWAAVYGVAQSRTRLKRLSSSSSTYTLTCL